MVICSIKYNHDSYATFFYFAATTGLPLTFPGCLPKFDVLAQLFIQTDDDERKEVIKDTEKLSEKCCKNSPEKKVQAQKYVQLMKSSMGYSEGVTKYFKSEESRVKRLISGNVSDKKKDEMINTINIIKSFQPDLYTKKNKGRDEL